MLSKSFPFTQSANFPALCRSLATGAGEVQALAKSGSLLLSGCADGAIKMWDLEDGQLIDTKVEPGGPCITGLAFVGPFMVSIGL